MLNRIRSLFQRSEPPSAEAHPKESPEIHLVRASTYQSGEIGEASWNPEHNGDRLTVTAGGLTIEWDGSKDISGEMPPCWIPASTRLLLHSGRFRLDFRIDEMAGRQIGVGFMLQLTDGVRTGCDWGFFGYLGSSNTAWAYDPSTGDVVTSTKSIEGGLPKFENGRTGVVQIDVCVPRDEAGAARFIVHGIESKSVPLPVGSVVLPAACFLETGQKITLENFERLAADAS